MKLTKPDHELMKIRSAKLSEEEIKIIMKQMPLVKFTAGTRVIISSFDGGRRVRARLYAMGVTPGTEALITSSGMGPCRIRVRGFDLVLGYGLASRIFAYPKEDKRR